jgi:hypothetical protein
MASKMLHRLGRADAPIFQTGSTDNKLKLRAQNLMLFGQIAEGIPRPTVLSASRSPRSNQGAYGQGVVLRAPAFPRTSGHRHALHQTCMFMMS